MQFFRGFLVFRWVFHLKLIFTYFIQYVIYRMSCVWFELLIIFGKLWANLVILPVTLKCSFTFKFQILELYNLIDIVLNEHKNLQFTRSFDKLNQQIVVFLMFPETSKWNSEKFYFILTIILWQLIGKSDGE